MEMIAVSNQPPSAGRSCPRKTGGLQERAGQREQLRTTKKTGRNIEEGCILTRRNYTESSVAEVRNKDIRKK